MLAIAMAALALISSDRLLCQANLDQHDVDQASVEEKDPIDSLLDMIHEGAHLILFNKEGCIYSEHFQPTWDEFVSLADDGVVQKFTVLCNKQNQICDYMNVHAFPAIIWYQDGDEFDRYYGERSVSKLQEYVNRMLQHSQ